MYTPNIKKGADFEVFLQDSAPFFFAFAIIRLLFQLE